MASKVVEFLNIDNRWRLKAIKKLMEEKFILNELDCENYMKKYKLLDDALYMQTRGLKYNQKKLFYRTLSLSKNNIQSKEFYNEMHNYYRMNTKLLYLSRLNFLKEYEEQEYEKEKEQEEIKEILKKKRRNNSTG